MDDSKPFLWAIFKTIILMKSDNLLSWLFCFSSVFTCVVCCQSTITLNLSWAIATVATVDEAAAAVVVSVFVDIKNTKHIVLYLCAFSTLLFVSVFFTEVYLLMHPNPAI